MMCQCGVEVFMRDGFPYSADYTREFPGDEPLRHARLPVVDV
jgi:hypothetical protein